MLPRNATGRKSRSISYSTDVRVIFTCHVHAPASFRYVIFLPYEVADASSGTLGLFCQETHYWLMKQALLVWHILGIFRKCKMCCANSRLHCLRGIYVASTWCVRKDGSSCSGTSLRNAQTFCARLGLDQDQRLGMSQGLVFIFLWSRGATCDAMRPVRKRESTFCVRSGCVGGDAESIKVAIRECSTLNW